jgi:hypothetical protein
LTARDKEEAVEEKRPIMVREEMRGDGLGEGKQIRLMSPLVISPT